MPSSLEIARDSTVKAANPYGSFHVLCLLPKGAEVLLLYSGTHNRRYPEVSFFYFGLSILSLALGLFLLITGFGDSSELWPE